MHFDDLDSTIDLPDTERYITAKREVLQIVGKLKRGEYVTKGRLSTEITAAGRAVLNDVLLDLADDRKVIFDPDQPSPQRIYRR